METLVVVAGVVGALVVAAGVWLLIERDASRGAVDAPGKWTVVVLAPVAAGVLIGALGWGVWLIAALAVAMAGPLAYFLARVPPERDAPAGDDFRLPSAKGRQRPGDGERSDEGEDETAAGDGSAAEDP